MPIRAPVALNADRSDVGEEYDGALPDLGIQPRLRQLLASDGVGITQNLETVSGNLTHDADAKARPRKGLPADDDLRESQLAADGAHLVLEEGA